MVAAIVAGDPDGIGEAYDRYAAPLYACCRSMLTEAGAAQAVLNTFLIAVARLDGLGDPDRLGAWLRVVARNECLRLRRPGGAGHAAGPVVPGAADPGDEPPAVTLPHELRGKVLAACADNSPAGRAQRMTVAYHAGPFGPTGFPKAASASGPPWWQRVRRRPGLAAAVAVLAAVTLSAGITVAMTAGDSHRPQAAALGFSGAAAPGSASGAPTSRASTAPSPADKTSPPPSHPAPAPTASGGAPSPGRSTPAHRDPPSRPSSAPPPPSPSPSPSPSRSPSPSPSPSASRSPSPAKGYLVLAPGKLSLTSAKGKPAHGTFVLTALHGPVSRSVIKVPAAMAGKVTTSPATLSLASGEHVDVTVTVTSQTALSTQLTVQPGNLTVQVTYTVKV